MPGGRRVESGGVAGGVRRVVSDGVVGVVGVVAGGVVTMPPGGHHQCVAHHRCCTTGRPPLGALPRAAPGATAIGCGGNNGWNSADESAGSRKRTRCDGHHQCGAHQPYCFRKYPYCARRGDSGRTAGSRKRSGVPTLSAARISVSPGATVRGARIA